MPHETGLIARARGLLQHMIPRATLETLAEAPDQEAFSRGVARLGARMEPTAVPWDLAAFERAVRQTGARHLATLRRWQENEISPIDIFTDDADRRSARRLIRGAMMGAPAAARLEGLTPTPRLPERVLGELARQPSPSAVVGLLAAAGHPDAAALAALVSGTQPEPFAIDRVLLEGWASRARTLARHDPVLRDVMQLRSDVANTQTALLLAGGPRDFESSRAYVEGGRFLAARQFVAAAATPMPSEALSALHRMLAGTPMAALLPAAASDVDILERNYYAHTLERLGRQARRDPLGTATLLRTLFRIEAQGHDLRALAWGAVFGAPPALRKRLLVTPWP